MGIELPTKQDVIRTAVMYSKLYSHVKKLYNVRKKEKVDNLCGSKIKKERLFYL